MKLPLLVPALFALSASVLSSPALAQRIVAFEVADNAPGPQPNLAASASPVLGQLYPLTEDLNVAPWGFVGMGTTNPLAPLDVLGRSHGAWFRFYDFPSGAGAQLLSEFHGSGGNGPQVRFTGAGGGFIDLGQNSGGDFVVEQNDAERLVIEPGGRVGVSTSSPIAQFDVENGVWIDRNPFGLGEGVIMTINSNNLRAGFLGPVSQGGYYMGVHKNDGIFLGGGILHDPVTDVTSIEGDVKNFRQTNPRDPSTDIVYACVEGPEAAAYVRGTATLVDGSARVELPGHFVDVSSGQGMTVQITPRSAASRGLAVVERGKASFEVAELMNGTGTYDFDWEVKVVRAGFESYDVVRPKLRSPERVRENTGAAANQPR